MKVYPVVRVETDPYGNYVDSNVLCVYDNQDAAALYVDHCNKADGPNFQTYFDELYLTEAE